MAIEILEDEADKKRRHERILQQMGHADTTKLLNPDQGKRYRFANKKSRTFARAQSRGFVKTDPNGETQAEYGVVKDGAITLGEGTDVILMEEPLELYEAKRAKLSEEYDKRMATANEAAKENINRIARNEGRVPAHTDVTIDRSHPEPTIQGRRK